MSDLEISLIILLQIVYIQIIFNIIILFTHKFIKGIKF